MSAVFAYRMLDAHLRPGGKAALVMPSSLLRSSASSRFRRFTLPNGTPLGLDHVTDFGALRVFGSSGATNRTALLCWTKDKASPPQIPAQSIESAKSPSQDASWQKAQAIVRLRPCVARFSGKDRCLALLPEDGIVTSLEGATSHIRGRKGVTTDLNGAYFVRVVGPGSAPGLIRVANDITSRGKSVPAHTFEVEEELVFPLLKGSRQIHPFRIDPPELAVMLPNRRVNRIDQETTFHLTFPAAHEHFRWIEDQTGGVLSKRSTYRRMLARSGAPFFSVYNVGEYTFSPIKVVWAEIARSVVAGIATSSPLLSGSQPKGRGTGSQGLLRVLQRAAAGPVSLRAAQQHAGASLRGCGHGEASGRCTARPSPPSCVRPRPFPPGTGHPGAASPRWLAAKHTASARRSSREGAGGVGSTSALEQLGEWVVRKLVAVAATTRATATTRGATAARAATLLRPG